MQPLKRFTQCGSLTMLFAIFIVLFGVSSTALTTFGKPPSNLPPATPAPRKYIFFGYFFWFTNFFVDFKDVKETFTNTPNFRLSSYH